MTYEQIVNEIRLSDIIIKNIILTGMYENRMTYRLELLDPMDMPLTKDRIQQAIHCVESRLKSVGVALNI